MSLSDLTELGLSALRKGLDKKEFSSVELTRSYLENVQKGKDLNAWILEPGEGVLKDAELADSAIAKGESKPLLGIPVAVKDMILTKGIETTAASNILKGFVPPYDAAVVENLKDAGALVFGKTNMDQFAMGSSSETSAFGVCRNPWDRERVPGGSSGGSAIVVSAGMAPVSLGTDTGGSIRQPASLTSVVGIKPTYGRVSRYGVIAYASSLDQVGPFARSVEDAAIMTRVLSGHDERDSTSMDLPVPDFTLSLSKPIKGLRVGLPREYFVGGLDKEVEASIRAAVAELQNLGAEIVDVTLPHTEAAVSVYYILAPAEASSNLARYDGIRYGYRTEKPKDLMDLYCRTRSEGFGQEVKRRILIGTYVLSSGYYDAFYLKAQKVRTLIAKDFKEAFATKCDVIACPASPTTAFKIGEKVSDPLEMYLNDIFTIPVNLAGLPGMTIPCGFDSKKLPIGLQLIGKPFDEETLFRVGYAYEGATPWHTMLPPLQ